MTAPWTIRWFATRFFGVRSTQNPGDFFKALMVGSLYLSGCKVGWRSDVFYPRTLKIEMIESRLGARRPFAELLEGFSEFAGCSTGDSGLSQLRTHSCCDASPSAGSWCSWHSKTAVEPTFRDGLLLNLDILDAFLRPYTGGSTQLHLGSLVSAVCDDLAAQKLSMAKEKDLCVCVCFSACKPVWMC